MEQKDKLRLTDAQVAIVKELEEVLRKAWWAEIGFVISRSSTIFAYNNTDVSCFDAPMDAAYDEDAEVVLQDLHHLDCSVRGDYMEPGEAVRVGLERNDQDWAEIMKAWDKYHAA